MHLGNIKICVGCVAVILFLAETIFAPFFQARLVLFISAVFIYTRD